MTTTPAGILDAARVEQFAGDLLGLYTGGMLSFMVDLGHRTGLFEAAADGQAMTSQGLADRAGLEERYVREWLGAMVTGGVFGYDAATRSYWLPAEHAACLTGGGAENLARLAQMGTHLGKHVHQVAAAFREGGGVPYSEFRPDFTDMMDAASRNNFDSVLVDGWLPLASGLTERLTAGARVADIGCGTGHAVVVLGGAYPRSSFVGYDIDEQAIDRARAEADAAGLRNVRFEVCDVARLPVEKLMDVVFSFDAIHDQVDPLGVLAGIYSALAPGGIYLMVEPIISSNLEDNLTYPLAPMMYAVSTLHCLTVSLAYGGAGLGSAWGEQLARQSLAAVGFGIVDVRPAPGDPMDAIYISTRLATA
jgi:SAM-dependent methyltransferase